MFGFIVYQTMIFINKKQSNMLNKITFCFDSERLCYVVDKPVTKAVIFARTAGEETKKTKNKSEEK